MNKAKQIQEQKDLLETVERMGGEGSKEYAEKIKDKIKKGEDLTEDEENFAIEFNL